MRPIHLSMTAFGPFAAKESVDFEQLGAHPLFLINGQTGSGKTTLLDAMSYALYGQTTSSEQNARNAQQMRCDYASQDDLTEVEFVFELGDRRYRIKRIPEQERAKKRGDGFVKQIAKATLELLNNETPQVIVAAKVTEATREIENLMGLKVDQFRQVMVLPQGQFRRLLMADSKDREVIFSQLFDTHIYKKIEDQLFYQAKSVRDKIGKLKENQLGVLQSVDLPDADALSVALELLAPKHEKAKKDHVDKNTATLNADRDFQQAKKRVEDFDLLSNLTEKLISIEARKEDVDSKRQKLKSAEKARAIQPILIEVQRRSTEYKQLQKAIEQATTSLKISQQALEKLAADKQLNHSRIESLDQRKKETVAYEEMRKCLLSIGVIRKDLSSSEAQYRNDEARFNSIEKDLTALTEQFSSLTQTRKILQDQLDHQAGLKLDIQLTESSLKNKNEQIDLSKKIDLGEIKRDEIEKGLEQLNDKLNSGKKQLTRLEVAWHQGQAALLARELNEDTPCPVCGSEVHPLPAQNDEDIPTEAEREKVQRIVDKYHKKIVKSKESLSEIQATLKSDSVRSETLESELGAASILDKNQLIEKINTLKLQKKEQQKRKERSKKVEEDLSRLEGLKAEQHVALEDARKSLSRSLEKHQTSQALLTEKARDLPNEFTDLNRITQAIDSNSVSIQQLQTEIAAADNNFLEGTRKYQSDSAKENSLQGQLSSSKQSLDRAESDWITSLKKTQLNTEVTFHDTLLDEASAAKLKQEIQAFDEILQQTSGAIKQATERLKGQKNPNLDEFQNRLAITIKEQQEAEKVWRVLDQKLGQLRSVSITLDKLSGHQAELEQEYRVIGTLSDAANGRTGNKISLQRFVLGVMLDEVLIQAGQRLKRMSKNRYLLHRQREQTSSRSASGLDLVVEDAYSGKTRPVATLSGGESFLASLSLALGLSDVVQARSGGIRLDTLFIDEGFGSLDSESLDLAIRTLIDLRNTGRMVGIISHVSELKEQLKFRIDVIKSPAGSAISLVN